MNHISYIDVTAFCGMLTCSLLNDTVSNINYRIESLMDSVEANKVDQDIEGTDCGLI
jgi:hypothetical protein